MNTIDKISNFIEQKKGEYNKLQKELHTLSYDHYKTKNLLLNTQKAQAIIQEVAKETQQELEFGLSETVTDCLHTILGEEYEAVIKFIIKRGGTECVLRIKKDHIESHPLHGHGGGVADVYAIGLIFAVWAMSDAANIIILDEPFKHLSPDLQIRASELLQEISKERELQLIIITNLEELGQNADKLFHVINRRGISKVKCIR